VVDVVDGPVGDVVDGEVEDVVPVTPSSTAGRSSPDPSPEEEVTTRTDGRSPEEASEAMAPPVTRLTVRPAAATAFIGRIIGGSPS
jgi:hypothetical protein